MLSSTSVRIQNTMVEAFFSKVFRSECSGSIDVRFPPCACVRACVRGETCLPKTGILVVFCVPSFSSGYGAVVFRCGTFIFVAVNITFSFSSIPFHFVSLNLCGKFECFPL